jgi:hypothetical protein
MAEKLRLARRNNLSWIIPPLKRARNASKRPGHLCAERGILRISGIEIEHL